MGIVEMFLDDEGISIKRSKVNCLEDIDTNIEDTVEKRTYFGKSVQIVKYENDDDCLSEYLVAVSHDKDSTSEYADIRAILMYEMLRNRFNCNPNNVIFTDCACHNDLGINKHETYKKDAFEKFTKIFQKKDPFYDVRIAALKTDREMWFIQITKNMRCINIPNAPIMSQLINMYYDICTEYYTGFDG